MKTKFVVGLVALLVVGVGAYFMLRRKSAGRPPIGTASGAGGCSGAVKGIGSLGATAPDPRIALTGAGVSYAAGGLCKAGKFVGKIGGAIGKGSAKVGVAIGHGAATVGKTAFRPVGAVAGVGGAVLSTNYHVAKNLVTGHPLDAGKSAVSGGKKVASKIRHWF